MLADTQAIALAVERPAGTIRSWAHRELLTRRGTDGRGRTLYDVDEAQALARRLRMSPMVETPVTMCNTGHAVVPVCPQPAPAWLPVPGWDGYQVSDHGQVRGKRGRLLRQFQRPDGYMQVHLFRDGIKKCRKVHILVALAFIGPRPEELDVLHDDGDPANNMLSNLSYGTSSQNALDIVRHGRHPQASRTHCVNDHEFTPANTLVAYGRRNCRACSVARSRAHYLKKAARRRAST